MFYQNSNNDNLAIFITLMCTNLTNHSYLTPILALCILYTWFRRKYIIL